MPISTFLRARSTAIALTAAIVALALATAYIHFSLGGVLFTLNALGYAGLAVAFLAGSLPLPLISSLTWLPRVGLAGFTTVTIVAYLVIGPYFSLGWIAKAVEVGILVLLAVDVVRVYGSPGGLVRAAMGTLRELRSARPMRSPTS